MQNKEFDYFCENIRFLRKSEKLSQAEMARIMKTSVKTLSRIERGELPPKTSTRIIFNLSAHFHIHPKFLFIKNLGK